MTTFISYRREDSEGDARALYNHLARDLGRSGVFLDFDAIAAGDDFEASIATMLKSMRLMFVIIGPQWHKILEARLASGATDYVHSEIAAAIASPNVRVVPVLVKGARMPAASDLPPDLQPLARRNALEVRGATWEADAQRLVEIARRQSGKPVASRGRWPWFVGGTLAAGALAAVVYVARPPVRDVRTVASSQSGALACDLTGTWVAARNEFQLRQTGRVLEFRFDTIHVDHAGSGPIDRDGRSALLKLKRTDRTRANCVLDGTLQIKIESCNELDTKTIWDRGQGDCSLSDGDRMAENKAKRF